MIVSLTAKPGGVVTDESSEVVSELPIVISALREHR